MSSTRPSKAEYVVGVDLGGTKILAGVFDPQFELLATAKLSTKPGRGPEVVVDRIVRCICDAVDEADLSLKDVRCIGIGAPGAVDTETGTVIFAPNLGYKNWPLRKKLEKKLSLPVVVENDCQLIMHGVYEVELKRRPQHAVGIFLGTGIGGAIILNRQMHYGFNRTAGEVGHMVLEVNGPKCGCGNKGCFEALASRTAIFNRIQQAVKQGEKTVLTDMLGPDLKNLRSGQLRKALRKGDKLVARIVHDAARYTGIAVANLMNILNPEVVVLGGGVIEALESEMMDEIVKTAKEYAMPGTAKGIEIIASKLGDNGGITGGAVVAWKHVHPANNGRPPRKPKTKSGAK